MPKNCLGFGSNLRYCTQSNKSTGLDSVFTGYWACSHATAHTHILRSEGRSDNSVRRQRVRCRERDNSLFISAEQQSISNKVCVGGGVFNGFGAQPKHSLLNQYEGLSSRL